MQMTREQPKFYKVHHSKQNTTTANKHNALTSSTNIITGASLVANEKSAFVSFSASPDHCQEKNYDLR